MSLDSKPVAAGAQQHKEQSLLIGTLTTALSLIPTAYVTWISNSVVLLGDFLRCVVEFLAILLSWMIIRKVNRGDKSFYDYGFGKLEQSASLGVALAMLFTFFVVLLSAAHRCVALVPVRDVGAGFALSILSVLGNSVLWAHNYRLCAREFSPVLESQWQLFRAKTVASLVVMFALGGSLLWPSLSWVQLLDPVGSLILAGFLFYSALGLLSSSMDDLLDRSVVEALRLVILKVLVRHEGLYGGFQSIRTRRAGSRIFIEIVLEFVQHLSIGEVNAKSQLLREELEREIKGSQVTIVPVPMA